MRSDPASQPVKCWRSWKRRHGLRQSRQRPSSFIAWKPKPLAEDANIVDVPEAWQESTGTTASVDMKKAVMTIQLILNKNGYDAGSADGVMGGRTKSAIMAFQKDNGLAPTGEVNDELVQILLAKK